MENKLISYQATILIPAKRVLVLAPHPDDEVFGCGGAIMRHVEQGVPVQVIVVSDGGFGVEDVSRNSYVHDRQAESLRASELLGYGTPIFWNYRDREVCYGEKLVHEIACAIQSAQANLIYAPSVMEMHPDHRSLGMAAVEAVRRVENKPRLALYEIGVPLHPNVLLDITGLAERKRAAMECFPSQLSRQRYDLHIAALNRFRCYTLPPTVTAAEAFVVVDAETLTKDPLLLYQSEHARQGKLGLPLDIRDTPLVSVIIRSMDRHTLSEALDSVALQTYPHIEVVLVNALGASHSNQDQWCGRFPLRLVGDGCPLSRSRAANVGLDTATGDYLIFLDDDDWFEPGHLAQLVNRLAHTPEAVAAYAGIRCVSKEVDGALKTLRVFNEPFDITRLMIENTLPIHAVLFRKAAIEVEPICCFDDRFDLYEDWDFWLQLAERGTFTHVDTISAAYRIHEGAGFGVQADEASALVALESLLDKWRYRWSAEMMRNLIGRARFFERRFMEMETLRSELEAQKTALEKHLARNAEAAIRLARNAEAAIRLARNAEAAIRDVSLQRDAMLSSRSWRLTAPLRRAGTLSRKARGLLRSSLWRLALSVYRFPPTGRLIARMPVTLKRHMRNVLTRGLPPLESPAFTGQLLARPLVSIIIPVFNHAEFVEDSIRSALNQTYGPVEVVVVDDASTDPQVEEILQRMEGMPRLNLLRNKSNQGISLTQNRALIASRGEVIAFLDCDDLLAPDAVETCLHYWTQETIYSHTGRININDKGTEINRISFESLPRTDYFAENLEAMYATHFKMIRRDAFAKVGLFDSRFDAAQDYDMLMRIAFHYPSKAFVHVPVFLYRHRLHAKQTTEKAAQRQLNATKIVQQEARLRQDISEGRFSKFLSIIMLSFGKHSQTLQAIESLERTVKVPHEIILFDNGSDAETVAFLKECVEDKFATVRVFYGEANLGPAAGRHEALQYAVGDWFIIFDNDEIAEPGWIEELLVRASTDERIGAVCCKVIFPNRRLQFSGGYMEYLDSEVVRLHLYDRDADMYDLSTAVFRDCDWCPIGATLFTLNPAKYLHAGYPNVFEDAGVSMALRRDGKCLINSPASWVWHEHMAFQKKLEMGDRYTRERYDPKRMLLSIASFRKENGLIIEDEYVWRENGLYSMNRSTLNALLDEVAASGYQRE